MLPFLILVVLSAMMWFGARARAARMANSGVTLRALPTFHGYLSATLTLVVGLSVWVVALLSARVSALYVVPGAAAVAGLGSLAFITPQLPARQIFEKIVLVLLMLASGIAVLTTIGIVASVAAESVHFFAQVPITSFLFGTDWSPTAPVPSFGFIPLLTGTLLITLIALLVAAPLGLLSAIYLAEYADRKTRATAKPLLELLAGIPTVVLGFFAALTVAPLIKTVGASSGLSVSSESALAAGLVMGMMIVPLISSLSDDVINAVPQTMRDGSYAMGATKSETIRKVVFPAALPGIVSAFILAISRAIGETMIVVMAAGLAPNLTFNPLAAVTTVTVQISAMLVGDQEFDSAKTLSAFALGLTLFVITLILNIFALRVVRKYKEQYA